MWQIVAMQVEPSNEFRQTRPAGSYYGGPAKERDTLTLLLRIDDVSRDSRRREHRVAITEVTYVIMREKRTATANS
jgi:hypothetical protein